MRQGTTMAIRMTAEEIKADENRNYNPTEWVKVIDRKMSYKDVEFFKVPKGVSYGYDRFYCIYTLTSGLRLMSDVSYSSSLTNGGFAEVFVFDFDENFNMYADGFVEIATVKVMFKEQDGTERQGMISPTEKGIEYMTKASISMGAVWTKILI